MRPCRALAIAAMFQLCSQVAFAADLSNADTKYLRDRASTLAGDIQLAELASKKAKTELVRNFGFRMAADHKVALDNIKALAAARKVELPATGTEKDAKTLAKMSELSRDEFDRKYMDHELHEHRQYAKTIRKRMFATKDPALRKLASDSLDRESAHLALANKAYAGIPAR